MGDLIIRPSMKLIRAAYTLVFCILFVCVFFYSNSTATADVSPWFLLIPALLLLWPLKYHLQRRFTKMTLAGDKLRYESGMLSRSKRILQVSKVQDVRVNQTLVQRLLHTGDLSIETAGETSLLTLRNVDNPDQITEAILEAAQGPAKSTKK